DGQVHENNTITPAAEGSRNYRIVSSPIFDKNGKVTAAIEMVDDITERIVMENQLRHSQQLESIGTLAGGIAHDFNNILTSVIGYTELALDKVDKGAELEADLQEIHTAGKRARELVKQILTFARQTEEEVTPIQVDIIVKEVLKFIRSSLPTTIEIKQNIESDALIMGNTGQIHQIMMNLCTNAAHAMKDGIGVLEISLEDVQTDPGLPPPAVDGLQMGDYLKLYVSDTGTGILPSIIGQIFVPYFTTKKVGEGTGLGLSLVHGIVENHGGKITVDSELGKGTTFTIYLPITKRQNACRSYEQSELPVGTERILFVDDELPIAKLGGRILKGLGYQVTVRTGSVEALELFKIKPGDFDLVITDMAMPNMSGDMLAAQLLKIRSDIPVILCTGYSKKISEHLITAIGIKAIENKPVVKSALAKTVRKVLDEAKG
ncbi:MAG: response regulator, partial [Desulfotignum sp.]|nr:response regulator [Desulfotignum sp.]